MFTVIKFKNSSNNIFIDIYEGDYAKAMSCSRYAHLNFDVVSFISYADINKSLIHGFNYIKELVTNKENPPTCEVLMNCGYTCRDFIDLMSIYNVDWVDLGLNSELFTCLSIFNDNYKKCILLNKD